MKKHLYTLAALLALSGSSYCLQAQTESFGFEVGGGVSRLLAPNPPLTPFFAYRAGIFWIEKQSQNKCYETNFTYQTTGGLASGLLEHYAGPARNIEFRAHNLEVSHFTGFITTGRLFNTPISFTHKWGIYAGYALGGSGRIAYDAGAGALLEKDVDNIFRDETFSHNGVDYPFAAFRRWDFGVRLGIDVTINTHYSIRFLASSSVVNIHPGGLDKTVGHSLGMISFGYIL